MQKGSLVSRIGIVSIIIICGLTIAIIIYSLIDIILIHRPALKESKELSIILALAIGATAVSIIWLKITEERIGVILFASSLAAAKIIQSVNIKFSIFIAVIGIVLAGSAMYSFLLSYKKQDNIKNHSEK